VPTEGNDLIEVLMALGYRRQEAEIAAHDASKDGGTVEEQLKQALRSLAR
jgi:Holliday junction resolvasome RuvABC DNA-binding subunit